MKCYYGAIIEYVIDKAEKTTRPIDIFKIVKVEVD